LDITASTLLADYQLLKELHAHNTPVHKERILLLLRSRTHPALAQRQMHATYVLCGGAKDSVWQIN
jgi:hypothetical protein